MTLCFHCRVLAEFEPLPAHLLDEPLLFSMEDLYRVKKGQLVAQARALLNSALEHVDNCEVGLTDLRSISQFNWIPALLLLLSV